MKERLFTHTVRYRFSCPEMKTPKYRRKPEKGVPVLRGVLSEDRKNIIVWCPYCNKAHSHGWDAMAPDWSIPHRGAHCLQDSPFHEDGYYIGALPRQFRVPS
jgi:hypothetical protein